MSGGTFEYNQYRIGEIRERIEKEIEDATAPKPPKVKRKYISTMMWTGTMGNRSGHFLRLFSEYDTMSSIRKYYENLGKTITEISDTEFHVDYGVSREGKNQVVEVKEIEIEEYADGEYYPEYSKETIKEFEKAVKILKKAEIYTQRIDYLIAGDDSEESFHERLQEELKRKIK